MTCDGRLFHRQAGVTHCHRQWTDEYGVAINTMLHYHVGLVKSLQLSFVEHLVRTAPKEDHHHVIATALRPPADWRRPVVRLKTAWLRTVLERLGGRQEMGSFGIKSSVRQRSTLEFANKERRRLPCAL